MLPQEGKLLKILCFNIHGGYDLLRRRDLNRIRQLMDDHHVDIGVFQEMETRLSRGGSLQDLETIAGPDRPHRLPGLTLKEGEGWYGNLMVSRFPILRGLVHSLDTSANYEPRSAIDALIDTPLGAIRLLGTHLSLSPLERWSEVRRLVQVIDEVESREKNPFFLMGDINEWRRSSRLLRHLDELMTPASCGKTFPSPCPLFRLDRVWHSHNQFQVHARVLESHWRLSDHLPVLVEVRGAL